MNDRATFGGVKNAKSGPRITPMGVALIVFGILDYVGESANRLRLL